jgi:hypothetical protein
MFISRLRLRNYKSHLDSGEIELRPGFNVVIGQNSSGKTALLEALGASFAPHAHRSVKSIPLEGGTAQSSPQLDVAFDVPCNELFDYFSSLRNSNLLLPAPAGGSGFFESVNSGDFSPQGGQKIVDRIFAERSLSFELQAFPGGAARAWRLARSPS